MDPLSVSSREALHEERRWAQGGSSAVLGTLGTVAGVHWAVSPPYTVRYEYIPVSAPSGNVLSPDCSLAWWPL